MNDLMELGLSAPYDFLAILLAAALSRFAGKGWGYKSLFALAAGICAALAFETNWIGMALIAVGVSVGRTLPLGGAVGWLLSGVEPASADKEWWQRAMGCDSAWESVFVLALMRAALLFPTALYEHPLGLLPLSMLAGVLLFAWLGKQVADRTTPDTGWEWSELYPLALMPAALML